MVVDHCCIVFGGPEFLRLTVGRVAMPLFFLVSGHLVRRLSLRHAGIFLAGVALPVFVPWIDSPNVLCWYVIGAAVIVASRRYAVALWLPVLVALAWLANFGQWSPLHLGPHAFDGLALLGIMGLGAVLDRSAFDWAARLPAVLEVGGRYPLSVYLGHLAVLQTIVLAGFGVGGSGDPMFRFLLAVLLFVCVPIASALVVYAGRSSTVVDHGPAIN
jgi:fucose 4-O-acetylase-like acetyltransferase